MVSTEGNPTIEVLDHGYITLIEHWGSDERVIESARMSTKKGFVRWGGVPCPEHNVWLEDEPESQPVIGCDKCIQYGDERLLKYLWEHKHTTPFEMAGFTVEVQAPIFVFREWHRHRTQSYNEMSARYTSIPDLNYIPSIERLFQTSNTNKQAMSSGAVLTESGATGARDLINEIYVKLEHSYQHMLKNGVPKELARVILPVGRYSKMRASTDLWNWLHFLKLRTAEDAQWEIRQYAIGVAYFVSKLFPRTWTLFEEGVR